MCTEHFDSLLQLATRMTDPNPDLRPVVSEVVCMVATNGASQAGGLAPDDSPIGAGVAKVGARMCASSEPRHLLSNVARLDARCDIKRVCQECSGEVPILQYSQ